MIDILKRIVNIYKMSDDQQSTLIRRYAREPKDGKLEIARLHQKNYGFTGNNFTDVSQETLDVLKKIKYKNPVLWQHLSLLMAIEDYSEYIKRKRGKTDKLISKIKEGQRKNKAARYKRQTLSDRIRGLYSEITTLRERDKLSWTGIAKYLKKAHRKYFKGHNLSPSYLRRTYNDLAKKRTSDTINSAEGTSFE